MSSEKKFRIQNGLDVAGEVFVNGISVVGANGLLTPASYQSAVQAMIDATMATGVDQGSIDAAVATGVAALAADAPDALNTLNELAASLGDDANFASSVATGLSEKLSAANNLSDLPNASIARSNLGLGTAATTASSSYATAAQGTKADAAAPLSTVNQLDTDLRAEIATAVSGVDHSSYALQSEVTTEIATAKTGAETVAAADATAKVSAAATSTTAEISTAISAIDYSSFATLSGVSGQLATASQATSDGDSDTLSTALAAIETELDALVASAPGTLDTLNELAASLNNDADFAGTMTTTFAGKMSKSSNLLDVASASSARTNLGLGTAATTSASAYATAAQGVSANTAVQPSVMNAALATNAAASATFAQGATADTAVQPADIANFSTVAEVATAKSEAIAASGTASATALAAGDATTLASAKSYADGVASSAITALVDGSPAALDTLNEIAAALGDDANFAGTVTTSLSEKMVKSSNLSDVADAPTALSNLGGATAAQGALASSALQSADITHLAAASNVASDIATAKAQAISTASTDATTKANSAQTAAELTASGDATSKVATAKSEAISAAASDATSKVSVLDAALSLQFANGDSDLLALIGSGDSFVTAGYVAGDAATLVSAKAYADAVGSAAVSAVVDASPAALDTLNEIAAALGDDADFAGTMTSSLAAKLASANNLSDVADAPTARTNLGLGTVATHAHSEYALAAQGVLASSAVQPADIIANATNAVNATISADASKLGNELPAHYRIDIYNVAGTIVN